MCSGESFSDPLAGHEESADGRVGSTLASLQPPAEHPLLPTILGYNAGTATMESRVSRSIVWAISRTTVYTLSWNPVGEAVRYSTLAGTAVPSRLAVQNQINTSRGWPERITRSDWRSGRRLVAMLRYHELQRNITREFTFCPYRLVAYYDNSLTMCGELTAAGHWLNTFATRSACRVGMNVSVFGTGSIVENGGEVVVRFIPVGESKGIVPKILWPEFGMTGTSTVMTAKEKPAVPRPSVPPEPSDPSPTGPLLSATLQYLRLQPL
ncbi:hypothetical protein FKP32DRAFT_1599769 [Trametes sanguinea]|nr:hypothetical protein FKP32DRAFT_1599769 [Trametes sanguinea]